MDLLTFRQLLTPLGQAALKQAAELAPTESTFLVCFQKLRKQFTETLAKVALETILLRQKARSKFTAADQMYFTREALEQASSEAVARYRASRLSPYQSVADLCCGIGGDTLGLAQAGSTVLAVDNDPLRVAMTTANVAALGYSARVQIHEADVLAIDTSAVRAVFVDPSRRAHGHRYLEPEDYNPPLSAIRTRWPHDFPMVVKIAPGVARHSISHLEAELEFISLAGELKECVLWFGPLRTASRRATLLPSSVSIHSDSNRPLPVIGPVGPYVFQVDPAVVRAELTGQVAEQFELHPLDTPGTLLSGAFPIDSPLFTPYRVEWSESYHVRRLNKYLRQHRIGRLTPVQIGSRMNPCAVMSQLKLKGSEHRVLILTRIAGKQSMIVAERLPCGSSSVEITDR